MLLGYRIPHEANGFSGRISDLSFTNSLATSSFDRCDKIRSIVHPVSSIWIRLPNDNQQAREPYKLQTNMVIFVNRVRKGELVEGRR